MHIHLRNISLSVLAVIGVACAAMDEGGGGGGGTSVYCQVSITRTKGMVGKHFSARISYSSNFVNQAEFQIRGDLPSGLSLDQNTGIISGTPTVAGFWQIRLRVRDRERGTHDQQPGETRWYYEDIELGMYDKLVDDH